MTNDIIIKKLEDILELITDDGGNIEDVVQALNSLISDLEYPNIANEYSYFLNIKLDEEKISG